MVSRGGEGHKGEAKEKEKHTTSTRRKLHVSPLHPVEIISLRSLRALLDHAIPMRQLPAQDIAEDLGVSVWVCREAAAAVDAVLV